MRSPDRIFWFAALGAAAILGAAANAGAQAADSVRKKFMLDVPDVSNAVAPGGFVRGAPGTNSGSPLAFGADWGDVFVGAGYQNSTRGVKLPNGTLTANEGRDGSVSGGFGLGNSRDAIGVEVVVTSLSTIHTGFFRLTAYSFQVDRMLNSTTAVAIGVEDAFTAGVNSEGSHSDGTDSWYAVASKVFILPSTSSGFFKALTISGGLGNGRFRSLDDVSKNNQTVNVFGSVSLLMTDRISAIADYAGQDLNLGLSFVPFKKFPMVFTPAIADVTRTASKTARFVLGAGIGMHFD